MYLIDTDAVSELRKGGAANPGVASYFADAARRDLLLAAAPGAAHPAVLREAGTRHPDPVYADLERRIEERLNATGAEQARKGRFELAEGGTIYLDDVDDIPLEQQAKLLRAIEEKVATEGRAGAPVSLIYNGVDLNVFTPEGEGERPKDFIRLLLVEAHLGGGNEPDLENALALIDAVLASGRVESDLLRRFGSDQPGSVGTQEVHP